MSLLDTYIAERDALLATIQSTLSGVENRDLSDAETRTVNDARTRVEALNSQIDLVDGAQGLTRTLGRAENRTQETAQAETRSLGEQFIESDVFTNYQGRGTSSRMHIEARALPTGLAEVGGLTPLLPKVDATAPTVTPLLDAISSVSVSQNGIEVIEWTKVAGGAAVVPEKTAKPSVEFTPSVVPYTLDTVAAYTQMTRQMIEDAPAVRAQIDGQLRREVALKLEAEAAAALVAATLPATNSSTLLKSIRKGVGVVQAAGYFPNAVLLNPADWADLDIDVFGTTLNGPAVGQRFWGLTPIAAVSQPAGTATVGDMGAGVQNYRRTGVNLYITDSHADTFLSNVFTLLAEARSKTVVTRPPALVECTVV